MNRATKTWPMALQHIAERALGKQAGHHLWQKYHAAFSTEYRALVSPRYALKDMLHLEQILASQQSTASACLIPEKKSIITGCIFTADSRVIWTNIFRFWKTCI